MAGVLGNLQTTSPYCGTVSVVQEERVSCTIHGLACAHTSDTTNIGQSSPLEGSTTNIGQSSPLEGSTGSGFTVRDLDSQENMPLMQKGPTYSQGYMEVVVHQPMVFDSSEDGRYTSYEIKLETNNRAFNLKTSQVRRRYSEFRWLRSQLRNHFPDITPPELPPRKFFGRQFNPEVIEDRVGGLQDFLSGCLEEPVYLSDSVLHLFLQTQLDTKEIIDCVERRSDKSVLETILASKKQVERQCSDTSVAGSDHSSGYSSSSEDSLENVPSTYGSINNPEDISPLPVTSTPATLNVPCRLKPMRRTGSFCSTTSYSSAAGSASSNNSPRSGSLDRGKLRVGRRVTFSPEVTVAEVIDRFERSPRRLDLSMIPSDAIASTTAY